MGLLRTQKGFNSIWVIMDRLTKSAHFLTIQNTYNMEQYTQLYIQEIIRYHGVLVSIVSDRDPKFTSKLQKSLQTIMGMKLSFSTTFHPHIDGQSERMIQTLEDMLRACTMDFHDSWDNLLPPVEFSYKNSFHSSIGKCRMRHFMEESVGHPFSGVKQEKERSSDRNLNNRKKKQQIRST